jgi:regulator of RNase E activity RraB
MATKYLAKVANGTYTDKSGKEQTSWLTIGKVIQKDNGKLVLKLDSVPVAFDGWVQFFDPPEKDERQQQKNSSDNDKDIPF